MTEAQETAALHALIDAIDAWQQQYELTPAQMFGLIHIAVFSILADNAITGSARGAK